MELAAVAAGALLGVGDAVAGGHEVELAGRDDLLGAERVAVQRLALEQPGDGLQADVGVRRDAEAVRSSTAAGPMWSTKHQAPTVRRCGGAARGAPGTRRPGWRGSR